MTGDWAFTVTTGGPGVVGADGVDAFAGSSLNSSIVSSSSGFVGPDCGVIFAIAARSSSACSAFGGFIPCRINIGRFITCLSAPPYPISHSIIALILLFFSSTT